MTRMEKSTASQFAIREWLIFFLSFTTIALAGICIILWRQPPKVVSAPAVAPTVPAIVADTDIESDATPQPKPINIKASDLVRRMMTERGFLIQIQNTNFILLCERKPTNRIYVAIGVLPNGLMDQAEVSILVKQLASDPDALREYLASATEFAAAFGDTEKATRIEQMKKVMREVLDGIISRESFTTPLAQFRFERGPRDFQDAFILKATPLDQ